MLAGADEDLVDRYPAVAGDDPGDGVGDVFRSQRLDGFRLALRRFSYLRPQVRG
ncbi:MAG: hypothetical protein ACRDNO_21705 [Trebonia sp.]